ncbi:MAG TPA: D-alanyl-D-alanine carboxypeptidase family protein [Chthoniobacteraceae bacterium]|jgi:D-alanyl-D-alanine carboxypeptidase (penicillin-binding protein 5/6)|nr:D-alanyl-D-alanine carboxypeptidase family protein [Chthoniobacteraceae bacterium]
MIRQLLFAGFALCFAAVPEIPAAAAPKPAPAPKAAATPARAVPVKKAAPPVPFAVPNDAGGVPAVSAASVIVLDAQTGRVLHEKNADQERPVASTQKLLTSLIVAEEGNLDAIVRVAAPDTWCEPSMLYIKPGETYRRGDLLRVLLVKSENDVARCLARDNAGSVEAFALKMNAKAARLGMTNSHFANPNGLPSPGQHSSARDMSKVAMQVYRNQFLRSIVSLKAISWKHPDGHVSTFENTNRVLRNFPLCNGMKTGYTEAAGHCLVSSAAANGKEVICVVLGDTQQVWNDSYRLLNWALGTNGVATN